MCGTFYSVIGRHVAQEFRVGWFRGPANPPGPRLGGPGGLAGPPSRFVSEQGTSSQHIQSIGRRIALRIRHPEGEFRRLVGLRIRLIIG